MPSRWLASPASAYQRSNTRPRWFAPGPCCCAMRAGMGTWLGAGRRRLSWLRARTSCILLSTGTRHCTGPLWCAWTLRRCIRPSTGAAHVVCCCLQGATDIGCRGCLLWEGAQVPIDCMGVSVGCKSVQWVDEHAWLAVCTKMVIWRLEVICDYVGVLYILRVCDLRPASLTFYLSNYSQSHVTGPTTCATPLWWFPKMWRVWGQTVWWSLPLVTLF